jgi:hypothetical protein
LAKVQDVTTLETGERFYTTIISKRGCDKKTRQNVYSFNLKPFNQFTSKHGLSEEQIEILRIKQKQRDIY